MSEAPEHSEPIPEPEHGVATHRGCRLHFSVRGKEGPVVLMIQGVAVHGDGWLPQAKAMSTRFRCVTFDNRGMGASQPQGGGAITVGQMAEDARAVMNEVGVSTAHLVGHSLGGLIALEMALATRIRVRSLALLCTFASGKDAAPLTGRMMWTGLRTRVGPAAWRRRAFVELIMPPEDLVDADRDHLAAKFAPLFGHDLAVHPPIEGPQLKAMRAYDATPRLAELAGLPTVVVSAASDPIAPPAAGRKLAQGIPGATFVEWAGASHGVPLHQPKRVSNLLIQHILEAEAVRHRK